MTVLRSVKNRALNILDGIGPSKFLTFVSNVKRNGYPSAMNDQSHTTKLRTMLEGPIDAALMSTLGAFKAW